MYLALDIGGTSINIGLFEDLNEPESRIYFESIKVQNDFDIDLKNVEKVIKGKGFDSIRYAGIGLPGIINKDETRIVDSANLGDWVGLDVIGEMKRLLNIENVYICHDVKAAAISEYAYNSRKDDFAFVIWGTGVGCTSVTLFDKKPYFKQVELGYQSIERQIKMHDGATQEGFLEYHCGGKKIAERFGKNASDLTEEEWSKVIDDLSIGLVNLMMLNYTENIVLSGGVASKQAHRISQLKKRIRANLPFYEVPNIELSKYGEDAGLIGALGLIKLKQSAF